jgi:hypothetical protein
MTANGYEISGDHKSGKLLSITQDGLIKIYWNEKQQLNDKEIY